MSKELDIKPHQPDSRSPYDSRPAKKTKEHKDIQLNKVSELLRKTRARKFAELSSVTLDSPGKKELDGLV